MSFNFIFIPIMMLGTMIAISSNAWFTSWMGLEVNLMAFIPLIASSSNQRSNESMLKYFLTQAFASSIFLTGILLSQIYMSNSFLPLMMDSTVMALALALKLGSAPLHFWFPPVMEGLSWFNCFILMTWQKLAPLILLLSMNLILMNILALSSAIVGAIGGFNQTLLRKIMAYSSINHLGWMIFSMFMSKLMLLLYFCVYLTLTLIMTMMFNLWNVSHLSQIPSFSSSQKMSSKFAVNLLSLAGLPPFLGFLPKWMIIQYMSHTMPFITLIMVMTSLLTLFFYLRITYNIFLKSSHLIPVFSLVSSPVVSFLTSISILGFIPLFLIVQ